MMKALFDKAVWSHRIHTTFFKVFETATVLITGALVGANVQEDRFSLWTLLAGSLFLVTQFIKFAVEKNSGEAILDELWASHELAEQKRAFVRNLANFNRINRSIEALNAATCSIEDVCEHNFRDYLHPILSAFFDNPSELACTTDAKIHIAILAEGIWKIEGRSLDWQTAELLIFRNDFPQLDGDEDYQREFTNVLRRSSEAHEFTVYQVQFTKSLSKIIAYPIPTICGTGDAVGCISLSGNFDNPDCCNLEEMMAIFGRILANAITKYNDCVSQRYQQVMRVPEQPPTAAPETTKD